MSDYKLYGYTMSPYSMKMRSYLRYRRIAFQWIVGERANNAAQQKVKIAMVPVLENPQGQFKNDSTFLIDELAQLHPERGTNPRNEADAFLAALIEDFADEWLLMPFFMMRWRGENDRRANSEWILYEHMQGAANNPNYSIFSKFWADRQVGLVRMVCGEPDQWGVLDQSLAELLAATQKAFSRGLFCSARGPRARNLRFMASCRSSCLMMRHRPFCAKRRTEPTAGSP